MTLQLRWWPLKNILKNQMFIFNVHLKFENFQMPFWRLINFSQEKLPSASITSILNSNYSLAMKERQSPSENWDHKKCAKDLWRHTYTHISHTDKFICLTIFYELVLLNAIIPMRVCVCFVCLIFALW